MRICFIGGGNMAGALIGGLLSRGHPAADLAVIDPSPEQRDALAARGLNRLFVSPEPQACDADVIVLAVKPQQMRDAVSAIRPWVRAQLLVSVAAGIRAADLSRWLGGYPRIVRAMPNTPALIGLGVTGLAATDLVPATDRRIAETILGTVGQVVWVERESDLDAVTAVSGSGPAYVFFFMEAVERAARELGLDAAQARTLTLATFAGAAQLAARSNDPPSILRERVTSKGGTTAAALAVMNDAGIAAQVARAMHAARERSKELGEEFGKGEG